MAKPPRPDKLPGPIRYKKPSGKPEDRPLERLHQEFEDHKRVRRKGAASCSEVAAAAPKRKRRKKAR